MTTQRSGSGEAITRRRRARKLGYGATAAALGAMIGGVLSLNSRGTADLISGDFAGISLNPMLALALAAAWLLAMIGLPLWGFAKIDELARVQNLIGYTGGCMAVLAGYPVWAMLYAGGFVPYPHAFGVFAMGFLGMAASFLFIKFRNR